MKFTQLSIFIGRNVPGALKDACRLLTDAGLDLSTVTLADTRDFGILRVIMKDWEKAQKLLTDNGYMVKTTDVVAVRVEDRPGGLYKILDVLAENQVNVEYLYAFATPVAGGAVVVMRFDDPEGAVAKLTANGKNAINFVTPDNIFGPRN